MKSEVITLSEPIVDGSNTITEIEIREPKAKEIRKHDFDIDLGRYKSDSLLKMASECSEYTERVLDKLCAEDYHKVIMAVQSFLLSGQMAQTES